MHKTEGSGDEKREFERLSELHGEGSFLGVVAPGVGW